MGPTASLAGFSPLSRTMAIINIHTASPPSRHASSSEQSICAEDEGHDGDGGGAG